MVFDGLFTVHEIPFAVYEVSLDDLDLLFGVWVWGFFQLVFPSLVEFFKALLEFGGAVFCVFGGGEGCGWVKGGTAEYWWDDSRV